MTTPTINEVDATNMPGVYELLLDEDMTIDSGDETQEMVFHITATGMAPVTRTIELYRPKFTAGSTLSLADINSEVDTAISDASLATAANLATVDTNVDSILVDTGTTIPASLSALNDLSAAEVNAQVDSALLDYDGPTKAEMDAGFAALNDLSAADVAGELATYDGPTNTEMVAAFTEIKGATFSGATDSLEAIRDRGDSAWTTGAGGSAPTVGEIADAVWTEALADHSGTAGSTAEALDDAGAGGGLDAAGVRAAVGLSSANLDTQLGTIDSNVDAVLLDTDDLQTNQGNWLTATGFAVSGDIPTATENADALLNRDMSAVSDTNARSPLNALRFLRNKYEVVGTTLTVYEEDDSTSAWTASLTANASADPITGSDPA